MKRDRSTSMVALLRAVNVGGTGMLSMKVLTSLCTGVGLADVRTYIQSGNVLFSSTLSKAAVRTRIEKTIEQATGNQIDVIVRTSAELSSMVDANPFPKANPSQVGVVFLSRPPSAQTLKSIIPPGREELAMLGHDIVVHYPDGMGRSSLKLAALGIGTVRNLNTVRRLAAMCASEPVNETDTPRKAAARA